VVELILCVQHAEPSAKVLVFSAWVDVLKLIAHALEQNQIPFTQLYDHGRKFEVGDRTAACFDLRN
jgi:SNF2 family DNA or RNA helicase